MVNKKKNTDLYDILRQLADWKRSWFVFKFPDLKLTYRDKNTTLDEFLKHNHKKTDARFRKWETTEEYKNLVALALDARATDDLIKMYEAVKKDAVTGNEKSVKLMLQLQKEIAERKEKAIKAFTSKDNCIDKENLEDELI